LPWQNEDEAAELICRFPFLSAVRQILIAERWPEVELELWKFISFPVLERQFLLISAQLRPAEFKQCMGKCKCRPTVNAVAHH
jgi:hypothetical protein